MARALELSGAAVNKEEEKIESEFNLDIELSLFAAALAIFKSILGRVCNTHSSSKNISFWI